MNEWLDNCRMYEIYPSSFYDSNMDGIGDLEGINQKLNYVKEMGFNGIWINPFFESEFKDGGYDVINYRKVDEKFGSLDDFRKLIKRAKELEIKIILDLVAGHTSDKHEWFISSQKAEKNSYSDYYIWTNNTFSDLCEQPCVGGNSERDGRYILNFFAMQPALNYGYYHVKYPWQIRYDDEKCKIVHREIVDIIKFWLELGADGFRVDMAHSLVKEDVDSKGTIWVWNQIFKRIKKEYPDAIFISEWGQPEYAIKAGFDVDFMIHSYGEAYNSLFRFENGTNVFAGDGNSYFKKDGKGNLKIYLNYFSEQLEKIKHTGCISSPTGNHDLPRISIGREFDELKLAYAFLYCIPNLPYVYYGDEIGQKNQDLVNKDGGYNRTGARTPMQWSMGKNAGFSDFDGPLYLPVMLDKKCNVAVQQMDSDSLLNFIKKLNELKSNNDAFKLSAEFEVIKLGENGYPIVLKRMMGNSQIVCAFNPSVEQFETDIINNRILLGQNYSIKNNKLVLNGIGFFIMQPLETEK